MAWTDLSSTAPDDVAFDIFPNSDDTSVTNRTTMPWSLELVISRSNAMEETSHMQMKDIYNIPGFEGYQPASTPNPIAGNIDEGGGGGDSRPSTGFLYPRGSG